MLTAYDRWLHIKGFRCRCLIHRVDRKTSGAPRWFDLPSLYYIKSVLNMGVAIATGVWCLKKCFFGCTWFNPVTVDCTGAGSCRGHAVVVCCRIIEAQLFTFGDRSVIYGLWGSSLPRVIVWLIIRAVKKQVYAVGMSHHNHEEVNRINQLNLDSLSTYLGTRRAYSHRAKEKANFFFWCLSLFLWSYFDVLWSFSLSLGVNRPLGTVYMYR